MIMKILTVFLLLVLSILDNYTTVKAIKYCSEVDGLRKKGLLLLLSLLSLLATISMLATRNPIFSIPFASLAILDLIFEQKIESKIFN